MRVAIYTRISTDELHQPNSLEVQERRLEMYAKSQEQWRIVRRYVDTKSGKSLDRSGLQEAIADQESGVYDLLLVNSLDRLSRNLHDILTLVKREFIFRSASESFQTDTPEGRLMMQQLGSFAEFERERHGTRIKNVQQRKAERGEWPAGKPPFGYELPKGDKQLRAIPLEASIVEEIFERYVRRLEGSATIAHALNERGSRTRGGRAWDHNRVLGILRSRVYVGFVPYAREWYEAQHPRLIDEETFVRAQEILRERGEDASLRRSNLSDYLLTGLVTCARCGKRYVGAAAHGRGGRYAYYVCQTLTKQGKRGCDAERVPAPELEDAVLNQIVKMLGSEEIVTEAIRQAHAALEAAEPKRSAEIARLRVEIRRQTEARDRYYDAFERGELEPALLGERLREITARLETLEARLEDVSRDSRAPLQPLTDDDLAALASAAKEVIATGAHPQRKALVQAMVADVRVVSRAEIWPFFKIPVVRPPSQLVPPTGFEPVLRP